MLKKITGAMSIYLICILVLVAFAYSDDTSVFSIRPIVSCYLESDTIPAEQCENWGAVVGEAYAAYEITLNPDETAVPVDMVFPQAEGKNAFLRNEIFCTNPNQIAVAKFVDGEWQILSSSYVEPFPEPTSSNSHVGAEISEPGIYAVVQRLDSLVSEADVTSGNFCEPVAGCGTLGTFATNPSKVYLGDTVTFSFCGIVPGCDASSPDRWTQHCPFQQDGTFACSSEAGDCCLIAKDNICDPDCWPMPSTDETGALNYVDPDCIDLKANPGCRWTMYDRTGDHFTPVCDTECTNYTDFACEDEASTSDPRERDTCLPIMDSKCDSDCGNLTHNAGGKLVQSYVDPDCCIKYGIEVNGNTGNCCSPACDGICDLDCFPGQDPDCSAKRCARADKQGVLQENAACCIRNGDGICDRTVTYVSQFTAFAADYRRRIAENEETVDTEGLEGEDAEIYNKYIEEYNKFVSMYTLETRANSPDDCA